MSYLQVGSGSWLHIEKQRKKNQQDIGGKSLGKELRIFLAINSKFRSSKPCISSGVFFWYYSELRNVRFVNCLGTYYISCLFYF